MADFALSVAALAFHSTQLDVIDHDGQRWLPLPQIEGALGYSHQGRALSTLYTRHAAEFSSSMTKVVIVPTVGGDQETRIFSLRGAHLLGMFARTARAAEFRRWVLDVLEVAVAPPALPAPAPAALPAPAGESFERVLADRDALRALLATRMLKEEPYLRKVMYYYTIEGLSHNERARLMGWKSNYPWYEALKRLAALGLVEYTPDAAQRAAGKVNMAKAHLTRAANIRANNGRSPKDLTGMRAIRSKRLAEERQQLAAPAAGAQRDE